MNYNSVQANPKSNSTEFLIGGDDDGDGLLNSWEINGLDINNDGNIDLDLPAMGSDPSHKDIFVEVDFMENHRPNQAALDEVITSFANSPSVNPDGNNGINLHINIDEQLPHEDNMNSDDLYEYKGLHLGNVVERADANRDNVINAREIATHYAIFGHTQPYSTSSGESPNMPGKEFMVTLGASKWGSDPATGHNVGSIDQQSGTFMHELGHNLGLDHGGWNDINCKPNYLSVMNYAYQMSSLLGNRTLDYSRSVLPLLNENNLNEVEGLGMSTPPNMISAYGPPPIKFTFTGIPVDWSRDDTTTDLGVHADINNIPSEGCLRSSGENLAGYNDWASLTFGDVSNGTGSTHSGAGQKEFTTEDLIGHRILLWESIKDLAYPVNPIYYNFSNPTEVQNYQLTNAILNDTYNNMTNLLVTSQLKNAINQTNELKELYKVTNDTKPIWYMDNMVTVLQKQI
ncbi:hypothetical protein [Candidatus Nitrosocosmicus sp. SS]|uniref:hypothetical protein n=1 Tax=Candidatus Nitrosocosmicus agrestis TaxID=2563600 RepID=UPI00122E0138|nr:hypothetical protein [Candidatus Nitrosocosmicus sp. SS]KAA2282090.1 hypothetical protein F1Z66_06525 [Candidatus Nitrosocosmicus sp. SS]KAF0870065.1 hypothetical protein E5N71_02285 [Candidatus Nitrosocosmicus sp. SS]